MAKDVWDKASVISGFLASVVIALVGLGVTSSIQRAQIASSAELAKAQSVAEQQRAEQQAVLEQSRLAKDLLDALTTSDPARKELAIQLLAGSMPTQRFEQIALVIARNDASEQVRRTALRILGESRWPQVLRGLRELSVAPDRNPSERDVALESLRRVAIRAGLGPNTFVFGAAADYAAMEDERRGHGSFTFFLLRGLRGDADYNGDGFIAADELGAFLEYEMGREQQEQRPVSVFSGAGDSIVDPGAPKISKLRGVVIGVSEYESGFPRLHFPTTDAHEFAELLGTRAGKKSASVKLITDAEATIENVERSIREATEGADESTLLVVYFGGVGAVDESGEPYWLLYDSRESSGLRLSELKQSLGRSAAGVKAVFIDSSFAIPLAEPKNPSGRGPTSR